MKCKFLLIIKADTNDADYIESSNYVEEESIEVIKKAAKIISEFKPYSTEYEISGKSYTRTHRHNWSTGEGLREDLGEKSPEELYIGENKLTEEEFNIFEDYLPYYEYGIHTIKSIRLLKVDYEENLLG